MNKILLIISFLRASDKTVDEAIHLAQEKQAELVVSFVIDVEYAEKIAHRLTTDGWIGMKPSEHLLRSILQEYKSQAETKIAEIEQRAKTAGVGVRSIIRRGAVLDETLKIANKEKPTIIVITRRKRSNLSRLIFGSLAKALQKQANCEVRIIDAE